MRAEGSLPPQAADESGPGRPLVAGAFVLVFLAACAGISVYWLLTKPRSKRRKPEPRAALVEVLDVRARPFPVKLLALGEVGPAREVSLAPRVSGEIAALSPRLVPGGRFAAGEVFASVDPADYQLALEQAAAEVERRTAELERLESQAAQRRADVVRADSELKLEMGRQDVARREYKLLGEVIGEEDRDFVLRKPQLAAAEAGCAAARAAEASAKASCRAARSSLSAARTAQKRTALDLARTGVKAPFNAIVLEKSVELGAQVSAGKSITTLAGTDEYWVEVSVPTADLKWISFPSGPGGKGSVVRVFDRAAWGEGAFRTGRVLRMAAQLEPSGRLARIIVSVKDPLSLRPENASKPRLTLGAYVRAEIEGRVIPEALPIPAAALREGRHVWIMNAESKLEIRDVGTCWRGRELVCVEKGLRAGERVVTSELGTPVAGMSLRLKSDAGAKRGPRGGGGRPGGKKPAEGGD
ncbi:MAG: efflux RND transporter periplasmic adaptor subunit [Planctomycetota bacterium]|jgi:multidrug efflux pump subunit AcrA (membrane-fusion protein)